MEKKYEVPNIFPFVLILLLHHTFLFKFCQSLNVNPGNKWPNGVVKYKFHDKLTLKHMAAVKKAINVYHSKTCIRFLPWQEGDLDFVSIEQSGKGQEWSVQNCKVGGYQYARFGEQLAASAHMIELLGYALCLRREHRRVDRDEYLSFQENCTETPTILSSSSPLGIYDYKSQWHWGCNGCKAGWPKMANVTKCGQPADGGLSVLDADGINSLYNCQGCNRHRWRPVKNLTHDDKANLHSFGYEAKDGSPLFPCRARTRAGSVMAGTYDDLKKTCLISEDSEHYEVKANVEVLTIPGGPMEQCSEYKLVNKVDATLSNSIAEGGWNNDYKWKGYVAYASVNTTRGVIENSVGTIWAKDGATRFDRKAQVSVGAAGVQATEYQVLTCVTDTACMLNELYADRKKCT